MQRVRAMLPYLREFGWDSEILCVDPLDIAAERDESLAENLPPVPIHRIRAIPLTWTAPLGMRTLSFRASNALAKAGDHLLQNHRFHAVFFSTTQYGVLPIAIKWKRKYKIPYILDIQDPWVSEYHYESTPPGGWLKYRFSQYVARRQEPSVICNADHVVCVSSKYIDDFLTRYPSLDAKKFTTLPFSANEADFAYIRKSNIPLKIFDSSDGRKHWIYAGRGGSDMHLAISGLFQALCKERQSGRHLDVHLHFVGTSYANTEERPIEKLAKQFHLENCVHEIPKRQPYFQVLRALTEANAILVFGSDDPGYTASKIYSCIPAGRPLLAIFHKASSALRIIQECHAGTAVAFENDSSIEDIAENITKSGWFTSGCNAVPSTDWNAFSNYSARTMTKVLCDIFDRATGT